MDNRDETNSSVNEEENNIDLSIDVEAIDDADFLSKVEPSDEWCFETDHVSLKNNKDYLNLLKTIAILETQRIQAVQDIDTLAGLKEEALRDPMAFVRKMERGEDIGIPPQIVVAQIPEINWSEYSINRPKPIPMAPRKSGQQEDKDGVRVRGRAFDNTKPETFNQLWTSEEQQRLEELLVQFPPEEVESRRWNKIALALGNRTRKQVSSRVQKYFIKLQRAGLPVPGRVPKMLNSGPYRHQHQRHNHLLFRPTTFFPGRPFMCDESSYSPNSSGTISSNEKHQSSQIEDSSNANNDDADADPEDDNDDMSSDDDDDTTMDISGKVAEANSSRLIELLSRVSEDKDMPDNSSVKHFGYKCDYCHEEPLLGTRWHCMDCNKTSIDFCGECIVTQLDSNQRHELGHRLESIRQVGRGSKFKHDADYTNLASNSKAYNYLDPNFMPNN